MLRRFGDILLSAIVIVSVLISPVMALEGNDENYGTIMPYSLSVPTVPWDLENKNNYDANLQVVGKAWLYTNYYFYPNGDGKLYVDYDLVAESNTVVQLGIYDISQSKIVATWLTSEFGTEGLSGSMYWYNLTPSHGYAIAFRSTEATVSGNAEVRNYN